MHRFAKQALEGVVNHSVLIDQAHSLKLWSLDFSLEVVVSSKSAHFYLGAWQGLLNPFLDLLDASCFRLGHD